MDIYNELYKNNVDWVAVENEIIAMGDKINDLYDEYDTYLADLCLNCDGNSETVFKLIKLAIKHGFDVKANNGFNGANCLRQLCWSVFTPQLLEIAEYLLDAGAVTRIDGDEEEYGLGYVLDGIDWRSGSWMQKEYDIANIYEAYYEMIVAYEEGKPYKGIRAFRECVGKTVQKVEKISFSKESVLEDVSNKDTFVDALIIWADGTPLIASSCIDFIINPYTPDKAVNRMDISDEVKNIIGAKITGLRFASQMSASISFDNGYRIRFSGDMEWGYEKLKRAHFMVDKPLERCPICSGMVVDEIVLRSGWHWGENIYKYHEEVIVLSIGDKMYQVYSKGKRGENHSLRMDYIPKEWIGPVTRKIVAGKLLVGAVMLNDNNQAVLIQLIDGNENIYITVDKDEEDVIYARTGISEAGEEVYVHMQFEDNSEWGQQEFPVQVKGDEND